MKCYSLLKGNELLSHENTCRNFKYIPLSERSQSEQGYILYDSNDIKFWRRQNYGDSKKLRWLPGIPREGRKYALVGHTGF